MSLPPIQLMTLEPAHFHAAIFQKQMLPGVASRVDVYAPAGPDLTAHLERIERFNSRKDNPTSWNQVVHASTAPLAQMLADRSGNVVVVSGRNAGKIGRLQAVVANGLHVLSDKPWIIEAGDFSHLAATLEEAERNGVVAYDAMTQRFEVSCLLPRELVNEPAIFGKLQIGSPEKPAIEMDSVHYYLKEVAGMPLRRPAWVFDIHQQGEGLTDVGTHIVDQVQWTVFPDRAIDYSKDIAVLHGSRWPTVISPEQFQRITGEEQFSDGLQGEVRGGQLHCFANNSVTYCLRGVHVRVAVTWAVEAPDGGRDSEHAVFRGTKSSIEVRQGSAEQFVPEVYVVPNAPELMGEVGTALDWKVASLRAAYPGLAVRLREGAFQLVIPEPLRISHEAHFELLVWKFLGYVRDPKSVPDWEKPNMLAKYFVTTEGVRLARITARNSDAPSQSI